RIGEASHTEEERKSPVGPGRVEQPDEASSERVGEPAEPQGLVGVETQLPDGRRDRDLRPQGPGGRYNLEGSERGECVTVTPRKAGRGRRRLVDGCPAWRLRHLRPIERGETPPECFHALRQEVRSVSVEDALAECEERGIGRATFAEKEHC